MSACQFIQCNFLAADNEAASRLADWCSKNPWPIVLLVIALLVAAIAFTDPRRKLSSNVNSPFTVSGNGSEPRLRNIVAITVLVGSISGIVILGTLVIVQPGTNNANIFNAVLPVFGTWVGTLLAYYFGKDNYESGAQHSADLARDLTGMAKLSSIPATKVMIPFDKIEIPQELREKPESEYGNMTLLSVNQAMTRERLPLFLPVTHAVRAVIHKSLINDFLVRRPRATSPPISVGSITLKDLLSDSEAKMSAESFVTLPNTASLADVKQSMVSKSLQAQKSCEDAFITAPGSATVQGWITNDIVEQNSRA